MVLGDPRRDLHLIDGTRGVVVCKVEPQSGVGVTNKRREIFPARHNLMTGSIAEMKSDRYRCVIVGAGIAGLMAAKKLNESGASVLVLDKGRGVGGRMATRRVGSWQFDHGAQSFTARNPEFKAFVKAWVEAGVARLWCQSFARHQSPGSDAPDGFYCGVGGMTAIPKYLATGLDVRLSSTVVSVSAEDDGWKISTEDGRTFASDSIIITAPMPQTTALLQNNHIDLPDDVSGQLRNIRYERCIALLAGFDDSVEIPSPGGDYPDSDSVDWLADNHTKGVSGQPGALTLLANPEFSDAQWGTADEQIVRMMIDSVGQIVTAEPQKTQLHRWRYSQPVTNYPEPFVLCKAPGLIALAGDGFTGEKLEGAALSGLGVADAILSAL